jgi:hypothetical protein
VGTLRIRFAGGGGDAASLAALVGTAAASAPPAGADGDRVVLVRRARVALTVGAASPDAAAVQAGRALEGALRDALRRPRAAEDVRVFASTAEYLAHFVEELAAGRPVDVWYFGPLLASRGRGLGDTLARLARAEPAAWPGVLALLRRRGLLPALLARLDGQAREALRGVPPPPARPLGPDEGWPLFAAAWDAALAALGRAPADAPGPPAHLDAPPGTLPASPREAFRHYLDTHPAAPQSWAVPAALGGCVASMVDWLLRRAGVPANSAAGSAALARHPWIDPAPVRRVLRAHAPPRAAARAAPPSPESASGDASAELPSIPGAVPHPGAPRWGGMNRTRALRFLRAARLLASPPAARAADAPEGGDDDPFLELQDEVWAVDAAASHLASRGTLPVVDQVLAMLDDADLPASPPPPSAPIVGAAPAAASAAPAVHESAAGVPDAPNSDEPAFATSIVPPSPSLPAPPSAASDVKDTIQDDAAAARPSSSTGPVDADATDRPKPAALSAGPPAPDRPREVEDEAGLVDFVSRGDADHPSSSGFDVVKAARADAASASAPAGSGDVDPHGGSGERQTTSQRSASAPWSSSPSHDRETEDAAAPHLRDTAREAAEGADGAAAASRSAARPVSPRTGDADEATAASSDRNVEPGPTPSVAADAEGGRGDAPERPAAGPLAVMAAAARQLEPEERWELAGALAARARARPVRLRTEAAGVFFLVRPWMDLGLPGLAARAGLPPAALRALLHAAASHAGGAPRDDPAATVLAWGTPAGEWDDADPSLPPGDPRRAALAEALRDRAQRLGLPLGPPEEDGDDGLVPLLVETACRQLVRWMHGFRSSSPAYVLREVVRRPGGVRVPGRGPVEVAWPSCALDVLLERAGYLDPLPAVSWWDGRGLRWER